MHIADPLWPDLPYPNWRETAVTLQLWTQIVGKVRLALTPWLNHSWQVPLYVSSRGLGTSPIPAGREILELEFDFIAHQLRLRTSSGAERAIVLAPQSVADFYRQIMSQLHALGITVSIHQMPNEVADPIPFFKDDRHCSYDATAVHAFWRVLIRADQIFKLFRTGFLGKASPVHFFWGSFDLAVTRFSGRSAPPHPGGVPGLPDAVTREAYSHEVSSAGFWPGNDAFPRAAFYSYAYPEPIGFGERLVPAGAYYDQKLREFILPYDTVRRAPDPDGLVFDFVSRSYEAAADAAGWDRAHLECRPGIAGVVRSIAVVQNRQSSRSPDLS
jgi:Family of unknown function (DUF5996)